nr:hypothetical protein [uncultured Marinifilum sp.]
MKIKLIIAAIFISWTLNACSQEKCKEIQIFHSYEHLYISYIAPMSCCDSLLHGPIIVKDSLVIKKLVALMDNSICDSNAQKPDVRFKVIFQYPSKKVTICFSEEVEGMIRDEVLLKYNNELCSSVIDIIEQTGAERPRRVLPPK